MNVFSPSPWFWSLLGTVVLAALGLAIKAFQSYRNSLSKDSENFVSYVLGTLKLSLGRYVSSALANQLGVRNYAKKCLSTFPTHLSIPSVDNARISIDSAYVHLSLSGAAVQRVSDESLLTGQLGSVLIFGEPGSGKSSLTKKFYRRSCMRRLCAMSASRTHTALMAAFAAARRLGVGEQRPARRLTCPSPTEACRVTDCGTE
jgi:hypothetical protein